MSNFTIAGGYLWKKNTRTEYLDGSVVEGGWVAVREITFREWVAWKVLNRVPAQ